VGILQARPERAGRERREVDRLLLQRELSEGDRFFMSERVRSFEKLDSILTGECQYELEKKRLKCVLCDEM